MVIKIKTLALYIFGFLRFVIFMISILLSIWFLIAAVFWAFVALVGSENHWIKPLTQYLYFLACSLSVGLMNEIEKKINKEDYDLMTNNWPLDLYLLFLTAHYDVPKYIIRKMIGKPNLNP
ncbi:hypothetical protein AM500_04145 [Bacillus sp. FJAT-18017]|nr:hypothetical protein AM500_04145 [Bacillus sp. FJAT-18017]